MPKHMIGIILTDQDGNRPQTLLFFDVFGDDEFDRIAAVGLPSGFVAYHLEDDETIENSERVQELAKLPTCISPFGGRNVPFLSFMAEAEPGWSREYWKKVRESEKELNR